MKNQIKEEKIIYLIYALITLLLLFFLGNAIPILARLHKVILLISLLGGITLMYLNYNSFNNTIPKTYPNLMGISIIILSLSFLTENLAKNFYGQDIKMFFVSILGLLICIVIGAVGSVLSSRKKKNSKNYRNKNKLENLDKKAQLKIQEMAFMLVAVFLFFILVGMFVLSVIFVNLSDEATRIAEERTLSALINVADSPELSCIAAKSNCIDGDKLITLLDTEFYGNFWPFSSLSIIKSSGFGKSEEQLIPCTFANYPNCDVFNIYDKNVENERAIGSFVAFCRKEFLNSYTFEQCELARMIAGTEIKIAGEN